MKKFWATIIFLAGLPFAGAEKEGSIQCANIIYGGQHTSRCFSDEFLSAVQKETGIVTERRFKSVKLDSEELFNYPFVLITGESDFMFSSKERDNLKRYLENGGFLLASAGCSNKEWDRCFRREMQTVFGKEALQAIPADHAVFQTVRPVQEIKLSHPAEPPVLEGLTLKGKLVVIYSEHGLNDTAHTEGCCCCGGNEIANSLDLNINIFAYALMH